MSTKDKPAAETSPFILNCLPSRQQETDWTFGAAVMAGVADTDLPESVDLRAPWWTIGDQGGTGACVGWATADGLLRYHFANAGWIAQDDRLSVRFAWMASKEVDEFTTAPTTFIEKEGTSIKSALDVARKYGAVLDADLPFDGGRLFPETAQVFYTKAARLKIASYTNVGPSLTAWRRWLASSGPIAVRLDVDATWDNARNDPVLKEYRPATTRGGHAVLLVGYTPNGFIVRNSWGKTWGDDGFALATDAYAAAAFTEAYGVSLGGAVPVAAGLSLASEEPSAKRLAPSDERRSRLETFVLQTAEEMQGKPFRPLSPVASAFGDAASLLKFLRLVEDRLGAPKCLTSVAPATLEHLRQGFFDELAQWALQRVPSAAAAEASAEQVPVTIVRDPAETVVFINDVEVPQGQSAFAVSRHGNTLRVAISGKAGDSGTGKVLRDGQPIAARTAHIPAGLTEAYSSTETFDA